ncbi:MULTISPECIES: hypothetical protein [unclassified Methylophaga]|jgi:hypothetical protein|uniref:hypothetical protein n=1 Tax=unclassified Methylophaga TaxID=2629249 RepID=UPI0023B57B03|nr:MULTISPECIES: hypothetical protein [unclassified Methylophaga]|tara:strand:- start:5459 stop:6640 length:1182 start_codon:yes stop_codon:yes gene_type:complete
MKTKLSLTVAILFASSVNAAEWGIDFEADPQFKYDDNELLREDKKGDFSLKINPTLSLSRNLENSESRLRMGYRISRYQDLNDLDTENPFIGFSTSRSTERSSYGINLDYSERESRSIAEEDTADFSNTSTTTIKSISPNFSYSLTELDTITTSASYQERTQSSTTNNSLLSNNSRLTDNETKSLNLAWQHQYSERLSGGISLGYVNYSAESESLDNEYDTYTAGFTSTYQLTELWVINGLLGARYLDSENTFSNGLTTTSSSSGLNYSLSATKNGELDSMSLSASRSLLPSSTGAVNEQDAYTLSYSRELSEKLKASVSTTYREYTSADDISSITTKYIDFSPSLRWDIYEKWSLAFGYRYRSIDESDGKNVNSNSVSLNIDYNWDGIHFSR